MIKAILPAIRMLIMLTILTGVIYPLVITLVAGVFFPAQSNGSLLSVDDVVIGSALIGQSHHSPRYFWGRPSATGNNAMPSGGSNLGPTSATLRQQILERAATFRAANNLPDDFVLPPDILFASGSGLDPHISPEAARLQVDRVAQERGLDRAEIAALVERYVEPPQLGILGQPRVNVLLLNLALDRLT